MTTAGAIFCAALAAVFAFLFWEEFVVPALAAAASGGDVKQAPGEAPQSGPAEQGNAQPLPPSKDSDNHGQ